MKTLLNIKIEPDFKREVQQVANELGFSISSLIRGFLKQLVREKQIDFSVPQTFNKRTQKILDEIEEDIRLDRNFSPAFTGAHEAIAYLKSSK
ncbi:MAG: type II toxin-antitoxin system RelB/DinJ family antitoxin [Patescibacteria group bacterium]